jgi:transposase-like protein
MNGLTSGNRQKFHCKDCGCYRTLKTTQYYDEDRKQEILRVYKERSSLRGIHRAYKVSIPSVLRWLKKKSPN